MVTPVLNPDLQVAVREYGVFWEVWPQFVVEDGEHRQVGFELELIGSHTLDSTHLDPACPTCYRVRSGLLALANAVVQRMALRSRALIYDIDSHPNSIVCSPAFGNRPLVSVSINVFPRDADNHPVDTDVLDEIKKYLAECGIHER
ncbi:MAG: hypothetical protein LAO30_01480 [Acidobacteriia bacterium]|nr:hypothetical protein [Terriglobia bacterium]